MTDISYGSKGTARLRKRINKRKDGSAVDKSKRSKGKTTRQAQMRARPPVLVRNPSGGAAHSKSASGRRAKRRFDISLSAPGAEMRLPSIPVVGMGWRWVSLALAIGLLFTGYYLLSAPAFRVDAAQVHGLKRVQDFSVNTALDISGESIFVLNTADIEESLLHKFPEFSTAQASIALPNTVAISVTERIPVLTWIVNGDIKLVDADGMAFPVRPGTEVYPEPVVESMVAPPVPQIITEESIRNEDTIQNQITEEETAEEILTPGAIPFTTIEMVAAILTLSRQTPEQKPLIYDAVHGLGWEDPRGWEVYFGDDDEVDVKLLVYSAIVGKMQSEGIQPLLISVEYPHAPFYRMER